MSKKSAKIGASTFVAGLLMTFVLPAVVIVVIVGVALAM